MDAKCSCNWRQQLTKNNCQKVKIKGEKNHAKTKKHTAHQLNVSNVQVLVDLNVFRAYTSHRFHGKN